MITIVKLCKDDLAGLKNLYDNGFEGTKQILSR